MSSAGVEGDDYSYANGDRTISTDGRYVTFTSDATTLVPGDDNGVRDVFVHDRGTGETGRIETPGGSGALRSYHSTVTPDGRYIAFSAGLPPDPTQIGVPVGLNHLFIHDVEANSTDGIYLGEDGNQAFSPSISDDGRWVGFENAGDDLPNDANGFSDVFVYDRMEETVEPASTGTGDTEGDGASRRPALSGDGSVVAFQSAATNLIEADTNGVEDIFLRKLSGEGASVDSTPPDTTITAGPSGTTPDPTPTLEFEADEPGATFECRIDDGDWQECSSPHTTAHLDPGAHTFEVRAADEAGNVDPTPASRTFTVVVSTETTPPQITINTPYEGANYSTYSNDKPEQRADFECADAGSGIESCEGTVADGEPFDRSTLGTKTFTVTATDNAGNTATKSVTYEVATFQGLILDKEPAAYWRLSDEEGSNTMSSAAGPSGEYKNEQDSAPTGISGDGDSSRRFYDSDGNGVGDGYAFVQGLTASPSFTFSTFFRLDDAGRTQSLMSHGGAAAVWNAGTGSGKGQLRFKPVDWAGLELRSNANSVKSERWHHVVATYEWTVDPQNNQLGTGIGKLYLDGKKVDQGTLDRKPSGSSTFYLGYGNAAPWLSGYLDEPAYFDHVLTDTDVSEIWVADPPPAQLGSAGGGESGGSEDPDPGEGEGGGSEPGDSGDGGSPDADGPTPTPDDGDQPGAEEPASEEEPEGEGVTEEDGSGAEMQAEIVKVKLKRGRLVAKLECSGSVDCSGRAIARAKVGKRRLKVGRESFGLGASEGGAVSFELSRKLNRKLHSKRLRSIKVRLRSDGGVALDSARRR